MAFNLPKSPFNLNLGGGKKTKSSGRTYLEMKPGHYGDTRPLTSDEIIKEVKRTGRSSAQIKKEEKEYQTKAQQIQSTTKVTPSNSNQMAQIFTAAKGMGEQEITKQARKMATGGKKASPNNYNANKPGGVKGYHPKEIAMKKKAAKQQKQ